MWCKFCNPRISMGDKNGREIFSALDDAYDSNQSESETEEDGKRKSRKHKRLLNEISTIAGVPIKRAALRSEPSSQVDEHLWSQKRDDDNKVKFADLLQSANQTASLGSLKKKIEKYQKSQTVLDTPLSKPQKEKVERTIAYKENAKDISKWAPTVLKNREAEHLSFPLNAYNPPGVTTQSAVVGFKPRTSLEKEIAAVLKGSSAVLERQDKELTESEERALQAVDLEEAMARRKELQKLRALQSYYESKCKRQKKIKSKKFRKILRKSEKKKETKKVSNLNEDEKDELINETEKKRVLERAHLRHRNTSKWAKRLANKGNRSKEETQLLHDQLLVSRELTEQKVYDPDSEDDENLKTISSDEFTLLKASSDNTDNPWLLGNDLSSSKDVNQLKSKVKEETSDLSENSGAEEDEKEHDAKSDDEWVEAGKASSQPGSRKSESPEKNKASRRSSLRGKKTKRKEQDSDLESEAEYEHIVDIPIESENAEPRGNHGTKNKRQLHDDQVTILEEYAKANSGNKSIISRKDDFLSVESKALDVDVVLTDNSDLDFAKSKKQRALIKEAFANDAVLEEFAEEKDKQNMKRMPKDEDFTLPGWGEWSGGSIDGEKMLKQKRKTREKKWKKKPPPSKDAHLKHVIINEQKNKKFLGNQVSVLPFPFSNESQFERSIRQPLGKAWNTPSMAAKLIQPRVSSLIGTIIDPIKTSKEVTKGAAVQRTDKPEAIISNKRRGRKK